MLLSVFCRYFFHIIRNASIDVPYISDTAQKVSIFGVFLIRNFPHSDQIQGFSLYFLSKCEKLWIQKNFEYGHSLRSLMVSCIVISCFQVHITLYFKSHAETGTKLDNETCSAVCYPSYSFDFILTSLWATSSDFPLSYYFWLEFSKVIE